MAKREFKFITPPGFEIKGLTENVVEHLVEESNRYKDEFELIHDKKIKLEVYNADELSVDSSGWVVSVWQLLPEEDPLYEKDFYTQVARINLSSLEFNDKEEPSISISLDQWFDNGEPKTGLLLREIGLVELFRYFQSMVDTGEARPKLI